MNETQMAMRGADIKAEDYKRQVDSLQDQLTKALEEVARLSVPKYGTWQPIETAPKGEFILVISDVMEVAHFDNESELWLTASGDWIIPTHWMPLPESPDNDRTTTGQER